MRTPSFTTLGGTLAIDFANTVQWQAGIVHDLLGSASDIDRWIEYMRVQERLAPAQSAVLHTIPITVDGIQTLRAFRTVSRDYLSNRLVLEDFVQHLQHIMADVPFVLRLLGTHSGYTRLAIPTKGGAEGLLALLAADWMQLIANETVLRVKGCANEHCLAFFIDASGRRKWCSMDVCGNRAKNTRYHQKGRRCTKRPENAPTELDR